MDFYELQEVYFLIYSPIIFLTLGLVSALNLAFVILFLFMDAMGLNVRNVTGGNNNGISE